MRKLILLSLTLLLLQGVEAAAATKINCAKPAKESERLLCQAEQIKARRVGSAVGGAVVGAVLGNLLAKATGGDRSQGTVAGAVAGGLTGYWMNLQNEIKARHASQAAQAAELKALAAKDAKRQKTSAVQLKAELKTVLLRSPGASEDAKRRQEEIAQIAAAADLGQRQAAQSAQGYAAVGNGIGAPLNGNSLFAATANDFGQTRRAACAQLTRKGSVCS